MSTGHRDRITAIVGQRIIRHTYGENGSGRYWNDRGQLLRGLLEADIVALVREVSSTGIPPLEEDPETAQRLEEFAGEQLEDVLTRDAVKPAGWGHQ